MKRHALFVGINEYKDQSISRLRCAGNDAKALCMQFAKSGFETSTLLLNSEASCSRIADELSKMMEKISKGDLFVFYFAGHGILHNNAHHLVASDANISFKTSLFPVQNLLDHIGAEKEIHRMFILDCCRADLQHGRGDSYTGEFSRKISLTGGMSGSVGFSPCITLCSCSHKEKAYEDVDHGYFTKAFLSTITDEKVKDFSDFQTMLQKNMASPHPQHIDWSGQLDLWKQVKLFPTWGKKVTVQTFAAPEEFYTIDYEAEEQEKILKEKNLKISKTMTVLKRVAKRAEERGDFAIAIKKLEEFITLSKKAVSDEENRLEKERIRAEEIRIAEEKRLAGEKKYETAFSEVRELTKKLSAMNLKITDNMAFLQRTAEVLKNQDFQSATAKLEEFISLAKKTISTEEKRLEKERWIVEKKKYETALCDVREMIRKLSEMDLEITADMAFLQRTAEVLKDQDIQSATDKLEEFVSLAKKAISEEECRIAGKKKYETALSDGRELTKKMQSMNLKMTDDMAFLLRSAKALKDQDIQSAAEKLEEFVSFAKKAISSEKHRIAKENRQRESFVFSPDGKIVVGHNDNSATHIVIPSGVTAIGDHAFSSHYKLVSIDIPDSVTRIGKNAFKETGLKTVKVPPKCLYYNLGSNRTFPKKCNVIDKETVSTGNSNNDESGKIFLYFLAYWLMPAAIALILYPIGSIGAFLAGFGLLPLSDLANLFIIREKFYFYDRVSSLGNCIFGILRVTLALYVLDLFINEFDGMVLIYGAFLGVVQSWISAEMIIPMRVETLSK